MLQVSRTPEQSLDGGYSNGEIRYEVLLAAQMENAGLPFPVTALIKNLSAGGAKARLPASLEIEGDVVITIRDAGVHSGRIAWRRGDEAGIAFDHKVDPLAILELRRAALAKHGKNVVAFVAKAKQRLGLERECVSLN